MLYQINSFQKQVSNANAYVRKKEESVEKTDLQIMTFPGKITIHSPLNAGL